MNSKAKNIIIAVLIIVLLCGLAGGIFYLCYIPSVDISIGGATTPSEDTIGLEIGDNDIYLSPVYPDKIYLNKKVTFTSSDSSVVEVDANGQLLAKKVGSAKITLTTVFFKRQSSVIINVDYGVPDKIDVEVKQNQKQYVGDEINAVTYTATSTRKNYESMDPEAVKFKWTVYDITNEDNITQIGEPVITDSKEFSYTPQNKYQKIKVTCTLVYNSVEKDKVKDEELSFVYNKITKDAFKVQLKTNGVLVPQGSKVTLGSTIDLAVVFDKAFNVDETLVPTWKYVVNGVETTVTNRFTLETKGEYTIIATLVEKDRVVSNEINISTEYAEVSEVFFDKQKVSQPRDKVGPFILTVKWNKYANPEQIVNISMLGKDIFGNGKVYSTMVSGNGELSFNVGVNKVDNRLEFYINDTKTDVVMDLDNQHPIKIRASIGEVNSEYFTYSIASKNVENLKIFASLDGNFDSSKVNIKPVSDSVVGGNRYNQRLYIGAKTYPSDSYDTVRWYINGEEITTSTENNISFIGKDVGEYHIYCTNQNGNIKSNTLVIPSTTRYVNKQHFEYLGDVNGRSVNTYITSQSDLDSLLEYIILNDGYNKSTERDIFVETKLQDTWAAVYPNETVHNGERFWIAEGSNYCYVNSLGERMGYVPNSVYDKEAPFGMLSRAFYRVSYSGNFSATDINKHFINQSRNITINAPTDEPSKTSTQIPYQQKIRKSGGFGGTSYVDGEFAHSVVNATRHFAIDEIEQTINVSTSSELFDAIENGYRPICKVGSNAEKIYNEARKVLSTYLTDKSTDEQKVRLINDWIVYFVTYDYAVTEIKGLTINDSMEYSAFYLEGVFGILGKDNRGSTVDYRSQIAVCDGRSKAFTLMCAIEGIRSVRVTGTVYKDAAHTESRGGHAWNKVYISTRYNKEPTWYVVDTTWNDISGGKNSGFEYQVDDYYLVTDYAHNNVKNNYCIEDVSVRPVPQANTDYITF